ncbi:S41 family peptidase [Myxococcota bacterium]|nr:S41 family peptidase [Myxococcota bacterium]
MLPLTLLACSPVQASASTLECRQLPALFDAFGRNHYTVRELTPEVQQRAVTKYIEAIDPSKTLLLDHEITALKKKLPSVFESMKSGSCTPLGEAFALVVARSEEDQKIAEKLLGPSYQIDETVELQLDPDKRGYAKTAEERAELVRKLVHFQMSSYVESSGLDLATAKKQLLHRYELATKRLKERQATALPTIFAEEFAEALDPHSAFMSADTLAEFQIQMRLSLEGIGAALSSEDGVTRIESLVPGGQAEKSGQLRPKDKVMAVAQEGEAAVPTIDMELRDVVKMIRGKKGTKVTLTIMREGHPGTFQVTIVRDKIDVKESAAKITYETKKVGDKSYKLGVLDLPSFYGGGEAGGRNAYNDVKQLLLEAKAEKVDGILLDLSRNGGGLLEDAVRIAGLFIREGGVVATRSTNGKVEVLEDEDEDVIWSGPLVVMTSPASASAAEILAGALKDYGRAVIVGGAQTFGKGTVQVLLPLPGEMGAMKVTTGMFFLPKGASTQHTGVTSDIRVPSILDRVDVGEKSLPYALPTQSTEAFLSDRANSENGTKRWRPITKTDIAELARRSAERVAKDPDMAEIKKELDDAEKNRGIVRLAELRKKEREEAKPTKDGKPLDARDAAREKGKDMQATFLREGGNILADLIATSSGATSLTKN